MSWGVFGKEYYDRTKQNYYYSTAGPGKRYGQHQNGKMKGLAVQKESI